MDLSNRTVNTLNINRKVTGALLIIVIIIAFLSIGYFVVRLWKHYGPCSWSMHRQNRGSAHDQTDESA